MSDMGGGIIIGVIMAFVFIACVSNAYDEGYEQAQKDAKNESEVAQERRA